MVKNAIFLFSGFLLLPLSYAYLEFIIPIPEVTKVAEIQIPQGTSFKQAAEILSREKLIRDKNIFLVVGRLTGLHRKIRAGYYALSGVMTPRDVLRLLAKGQIIEYEITIIDGDSLLEIGEKLSAKGIVDKKKFIEISKDMDFLKSYKIDAPSVEGYIFPETYKVPKGIEPRSVLGIMINKMREKYSYVFRERAAALGFAEREILTLASIIEKEAVIDSERAVISAVYHNRLKKNMLLQADPTAIYGIKSSKEKITTKDLQRATPYNTYLIKGLPPGPIASPGIKSIIAALYPADAPYIYFVSNNDGTHQFSITEEAHFKAVEIYRGKKQMEKENKKKLKEGAGKNESS